MPPSRTTRLVVAVAAATLPFAASFTPMNHQSAYARTRVHAEAAEDRLSNSRDSSDADGHSVEITYEGRTTNVMAKPYETILMALERTGASRSLSLSSLPYDCQRGNCLTCSGKIKEGSNLSGIVRGDDGLAPHVSENIKKKGYVLTCSSYIVGDGVKLELGKNSDVWEETYKTQQESEETKRVGVEASAKLLRLVAESDVPKWKRETEETLKNS